MNTIISNYKEKANEKHNYKYDYSLVKLNKTHDKVKIICPKHGVFEQVFAKHLCGDGCKVCGIEKMSILRGEKAKEKFINQAKELHKNKYNYDDSNYVSAKDKIIIICPEHGKFEQSPNAHLSGNGCNKCANLKVKVRMSIPWETYKNDLLKIHNSKYDYSNVVWKGADEKINVICSKHGEFLILPRCHKKGQECPNCIKETCDHWKKNNTHNFIEKSIKIWGNKYDYSKAYYLNSTKKLTIICYKHGEFEQLPTNHYKYGCRKCGTENNKRNNELKTKCGNDFEMKSHNVHDNIYDYSKSDYVNAQTKVIVICKTHGEFHVTPNNHLRGKGCPQCGKIKNINSKIKPYEKYFDEFIKLYGEKYDYSLVEWKGASSPITVVCNKNNHGSFNILPYMHVNGRECPKCNNHHSKISIEWLSLMEVKYNVKIDHALNSGEFIIPNTRYKADGYAKSINTIFEFHGDFWHGNPKLYETHRINPRIGSTFGELYEQTLLKSKIIKDSGYLLVEMWENDWKNFIKIIRIIQNKWKIVFYGKK